MIEYATFAAEPEIFCGFLRQELVPNSLVCVTQVGELLK